MIEPLRNRTYAKLFAAQVVALLGTGLTTVALALLAYDIAGDRAGTVLGTALALKMIAYVTVAPVLGGLAASLPRKPLLIALDLARAAMVACLPFVTEVWQIYGLIFLMQAVSAGFTPTFQATIPDILPDEGHYTQALSLSRLAYDLEALVSPMLAAVALLVLSFDTLFAANALAFLVSATLVLTAAIPRPAPGEDGHRPVPNRIGFGIRAYLATPRLRGLLALSLSAAAGGAMVIVNTVVFVKARFALGDGEVALAMAAFGAGSMAAALILPRLLARLPERPVMLGGGMGLALGLIIGALVPGYRLLLPVWFLLGASSSAIGTPVGRLLRRSSAPSDRPAYFAAQFSLSHACWLLTYPLAGWLGATLGLSEAALVLAAVTAAGVLLGHRLWPAEDPEILEHVHADLPPDHPHVADAYAEPAGFRHTHAFVIDRRHAAWPRGAD